MTPKTTRRKPTGSGGSKGSSIKLPAEHSKRVASAIHDALGSVNKILKDAGVDHTVHTLSLRGFGGKCNCPGGTPCCVINGSVCCD